METFIANPLNLMIFFSLASAVGIAVLPKGSDSFARWAALVASV